MSFKKIWILLGRCYPNIKPFMRQNIIFIILTECVVGLSLLVPLLLKYLIDNILLADQWDRFPGFIVILSISIVLSRLLSIATNILYNSFSANIQAKSRNSLFSCLIKKNMSFYNSTPDGELVDRLMRSPDHLHTIPSIYLERMISSVGTVIIVFLILFSIHPVMAFYSLIAVPVFVFIYIKTRELFFDQLRKAREESGKLTDFYVNTIRNMKQVKNFCSETYELAEGAARNEKIKSLSLKCALTGAFVSNGVQIATQLNQLGILIYGAQLINSGEMTIGTLVAFYSYLDILYGPFTSIIQTLNDMNSALVGIERYLEFYNHDHEEFIDIDGLNAISSPSISFANVSFSYGEKKVLNDVNFSINAFEKVLLVGKSGIGKTTIVSLIKRYFPCSEGKITIGGADITKYNLSTLRRNVAYLTQEDLFFSASIRENFIRVNSNLSDSEIEEILKKAELHDEIFSQGKLGLDTSLEKNAVAFSGGQRRRLSLAMIFACSAPIIIMDEPFAGLDKETQRKLWGSINEEFKDKSVIMIDHNITDTEHFQKVFELTAHGSVIRTK